jgi:hypothetical protein
MEERRMDTDEFVKTTLEAAFKASSLALSLSLAAQIATLHVLLDELVRGQQISSETAQNIIERISSAISAADLGANPTAAPLFHELNNHCDRLRDLAWKFKLAATSMDPTKQ